jgi:hypothetical protein
VSIEGMSMEGVLWRIGSGLEGGGMSRDLEVSVRRQREQWNNRRCIAIDRERR